MLLNIKRRLSENLEGLNAHFREYMFRVRLISARRAYKAGKYVRVAEMKDGLLSFPTERVEREYCKRVIKLLDKVTEHLLASGDYVSVINLSKAITEGPPYRDRSVSQEYLKRFLRYQWKATWALMRLHRYQKMTKSVTRVDLPLGRREFYEYTKHLGRTEKHAWKYNRAARSNALALVESSVESERESLIYWYLDAFCPCLASSDREVLLKTVFGEGEYSRVYALPGQSVNPVMAKLSYLNAYVFLWKCGHLMSALAFRERYLTSCIDDRVDMQGRSDRFFAVYVRILALLDRGEFLQVQAEIDRASSVWEREYRSPKYVSREKQGALLSLLNLLGMKVPAPLNTRATDEAPPESGFRGMSVAVVGPSRAVAPDELQEFDCIIVFNRLKNPYVETGARVLSAISVTVGNAMSNSELSDAVEQFDAVIIPKPLRQSAGANMKPRTLERMKLPDLVGGSLNHGIAVVLQVLLDGPRRLKVFGMNFYMAKSVYESSYSRLVHNANELSIETILHQGSHDSLSNRHFCRNLHAAGLIEGDDEFINVIHMTDEHYCESLQTLVT